MQIPNPLGPYSIQHRLGGGGFADVYLAVDTRAGREVALKVLYPHHAVGATLKRFQREGQQMCRLRHPHVVGAYEAGEADGYHYIAMQYMPGGSLADLMARRRPVDLATAARIVGEVAAALDFLHPRLIHRDLKPRNILFDAAGHARVADLGIARVEDLSIITQTGQQMGTPHYMAPEQVRPRLAPISSATDIWALGVILYEMVCGQAPFAGEDSQAVLFQVINDAPPRPTSLNPMLPRELEKVLSRALAKEPRKRYQRAGDLAQDVQRIADKADVAATVQGVFPLEGTGQAASGTGTVSGPGSRMRTPGGQRSTGASQRVVGFPKQWAVVTGAGVIILLLLVLVIGLGGRNGTPTPAAIANVNATLDVDALQTPVSATIPTRGVSVPSPTYTDRPIATLTSAPQAGAAGSAVRAPSQTPKNPPTPPPVATATPPPSATPQPTATPLLTSTPTPTAKPITPTPVVGKVVFGSDRSGFAHIFTVRGNGQGLRAITGGNEYFWDPVLSNDGALVAYVSKVNGNTEVFVTRSDGSNARPISNHPAEDDHPAWFPNNGALAFASRRDGAWEIYRMNADGSNVRRLTADGGDNRFVAVSPDGGQIAYVSQNAGYPGIDLMLINADGRNRRTLFSYASGKQRDDPGRYLYRPDWSPDGTQIAFGADDDSDGLISVLVINAASGQAQRLIQDGNSPAWSPDGGRLIYKPAGERQILFVADTGGSRLYQLTASDYNAWSPDWAR